MAEIRSILLLPKTSEREAAGKLTSIPGMVDAEPTIPFQKPSGVPRAAANGFNTGFLDIVELRIAKSPREQSILKRLFLVFFFCSGFIDEPASLPISRFY
jgi:hypothetical protein